MNPMASEGASKELIRDYCVWHAMGKPIAAFCILHFADKEFVESQLSIGSNKIDLLSVLGPRV